MKRKRIAVLILGMFLATTILTAIPHGGDSGATVARAAEEEARPDAGEQAPPASTDAPPAPSAFETPDGRAEEESSAGAPDPAPDNPESSAEPAGPAESENLPEEMLETEPDEEYNPAYAKFASGTVVYAERDCAAALGRLDSGEVLCLSVVKASGNGGIYRVLFDTEKTRAEGRCEVGFVRASAPKWLDQEEAKAVVGSLSSVRTVDGLKIPMISFTYAASIPEEAPAPEENPAMEEAPAPEEIPAMEEAPVPEEIPATDEEPPAEAVLRETVAAMDAALYAQPDAEAEVLSPISAGDSLSVLEEGGEWVKALFRGQTGYVQAQAVEMERVVDVPILQAPAISVAAETEELQHDGVVYVGETLTLKADLSGYDGALLLQWQVSTDPESDAWADVPGATGAQLSVTVSEENAGWLWRLALESAQ